MIQIYDKFYASKEYLLNKSIYGLLKFFYKEEYNYSFVSNIDKPFIVLVHLDAVDAITTTEILEIAELYNNGKNVKIIVDTSIECFVEPHVLTTVATLEKLGVQFTDITVLTGEVNTSWFSSKFNIKYPTINLNTFEMSYYCDTLHNKHAKEILNTPIKPRKLNKHFIDYKKNPRTLRKLFHAFMTVNGFVDQSYYSWHSSNAFSGSDEQYLRRLGIISNEVDYNDLRNILNTPILNEDLSQNKEWHMHKEACTSAGINLVHETHPSLDHKIRRIEAFDDSHDRATSYDSLLFLTEKTFKNCVYGLPFLNPGVPQSENLLAQYGYKSWDSMFKTNTNVTGYTNTINASFALIKEIANMPLQDLEDLLNSQKSLDYARHNREVFLEQKQFVKLLDILDTVSDKY